MTKVNPCKNHRKPFDYMPAEQGWADDMMEKGYKQSRCKKCGYYAIWRKNVKD
jgi:hypothetical protein